MSRLELIVIVFAVFLYLWWRVRRRIEAIKAAFTASMRFFARHHR